MIFLKLRHQLPAVDVRSKGRVCWRQYSKSCQHPYSKQWRTKSCWYRLQNKRLKGNTKTGFRIGSAAHWKHGKRSRKLADGKELLVHCWRGGMRSNNFCQFIGIAGVKSHQLIGGYKTYRQRANWNHLNCRFNWWWLVANRKWKSEVLRQLKNEGEQIFDLETLANHKGSVFGGLMLKCPTNHRTISK